MAVTTVDARSVVNDGDALTGWSGADELESGTKAEGTNAVAVAYNIATGTIYYTPGTALNLDTDLLYVQSYTNALQNGWKEGTLSDSSHMLYMNDGTNELALCQAGSDRDVFKHSVGQVQFQSFLLDLDYLATKNTNGEILALSGSAASFVKTSVDDVGSRFVTLSKALGGGNNCFVDIIRVDEVDTTGNSTTSNSGIFIYGGASGGTEGNFGELVDQDESVSADKGHGIIREYTAGSYGCQGRLKFGTTNTLGNLYFLDSNFTVTFEDRDVNNDKFAMFLFGNSTNTQDFRLSDGAFTTAGPGVTVDFSSSTVNVISLDTVSFLGLRRKISFPTDSASYSHDVIGCTFDDCDQIDPGTVDFEDCTISNYDETVSTAGGAVLLDSDGSANWSGLDFVSRGTGHAIYITATGTHTLTNFTYSGYGADDTTNASVYNNSGGAVTINVSGGDPPTVRNGTSATTTVVNNVNITVTVQDSGANPIVGAQVAAFVTADDSVVMSSAPTDENGEATGSYAASTGAIYIRVRQSTNTASFLTTESTSNGIEQANEYVHFSSNHNYVDGEAVVYTKNGGSQTTNLTDGNTYYLNNIDADTVSVHNTAAAAIAGTGAINLSSGGSETHSFDPVRYFPTSTVGSIGTGAFSVTVTMVEDTTVTG